MGVPSLFRTLAETYPDTHYWSNDVQIDHLYFDFNCLIHHAKSFVELTPEMSLRDMEEEVISAIISYTSKIVSIVKPRKLVYIAVDGPVPMGKVIRQRARRYKKVMDSEYEKKIKAQLKMDKTPFFDSNKITPGTPFMSKLCNRIKNFIKLGAFSKHKQKDFSVFLSDANVPGEGEHKIMDFIRSGRGNPSIAIYGLDADLIVLSLNLKKSNIRLLREPQQTSVEIAQYHDSQFLYFDIDKTREALIKHYNLEAYDHNRIINDFVFITNFGGNDFCDPFCHTKIRENGLSILMSAYTNTLKNHGYLILEDEIVYQNFIYFLTYLTESESTIMRKKGLHYHKAKLEQPTREKDKQLAFEMMKYEHLYYTDSQNPFHKMYNKECKKIDFSQECWKDLFNSEYFQETSIESICKEYMKTIMWSYKYYNNTILSWNYYYPYRNAPIASDLLKYMNPDMLSHVYEKGEPCSPFEQLMIVTPKQCCGLLPFSYMAFMSECEDEFEEYFPTQFKLDVVKGQKNIYSEPLLPDVNIELVRKIMHNLPLSEPEIARNIIKTRPFCHKVGSQT